jgi:hypothetical protein
VYEAAESKSMIGKCTVIYRLTPPPPPKLTTSQRSKSVSGLNTTRSKRVSLRQQKRAHTEAVLPSSGAVRRANESPRAGGVQFKRSTSGGQLSGSAGGGGVTATAGSASSRKARARPTSVMVGSWEDTESSMPIRVGTTRLPNRRKKGTSLKRPSSLKNIFSIASRSSATSIDKDNKLVSPAKHKEKAASPRNEKHE